MSLSHRLATCFAGYLLILGPLALCLQPALMDGLRDLRDSPSSQLLSGLATLIIGLLLVTSHNLWVSDWRILITLLAWFTLFKGVYRLYLPALSQRSLQIWRNPAVLSITGLAMIVFGTFLLYCGLHG